MPCGEVFRPPTRAFLLPHRSCTLQTKVLLLAALIAVKFCHIPMQRLHWGAGALMAGGQHFVVA